VAAPNILDANSGCPPQYFDGDLPAYQFVLPLAAVTGTVSVLDGSTALVFSTAQSLTAGSVFIFASQPGIQYTIAASTTASLTATLSASYTGPTAAATTANQIAALVGAVTLTQGSTAVTFATAQTLVAGTLLYFSTQPLSPYILSATITGVTAGVLTTPYLAAASTAATTIAAPALAGTVTTTAASAALTFTVAQTLAAGTALMFSNQPGVTYSLALGITASTTATLTSVIPTGLGASGLTTVAGTNDYLPTKSSGPVNANACRGLLCTANGTAYIDTFGIQGVSLGSQWLPVPLTVGQQIQIAFVRMHHTSTGGFVAMY